MGIDCYLKLEGVKGESIQKDHKDEIEILTWAWEASNPSCTIGSGSAVGKGKPGMLTLSKQYDSASPTMSKYCANGKHFTSATMTMTKAAEGQLTFMTITLKEVYIAAVLVNASQQGDVIENVTLSYADIEFAYKPQLANGSLGGDIKFGWNTRTTETR